jgi:lysine biosynthesis protein LysW
VSEAVCPICQQAIQLAPNTQVGDWVNCPGCEADLQVASLSPSRLEKAYEGAEIAGEAEDWPTISRWALWRRRI